LLVVSSRSWCKQGANETLKQAIFAAVFCAASNCTQTLRGRQTARRPITKGLAINWRNVVSFGFGYGSSVHAERYSFGFSFSFLKLFILPWAAVSAEEF